LDQNLDNYNKVYENQRDDVHPPFYYFLLRIFQNFSNEISFWPGIILNMLFATINTLFLYFILRELTKDMKESKSLSLIVTFFSSIIFYITETKIIFIISFIINNHSLFIYDIIIIK